MIIKFFNFLKKIIFSSLLIYSFDMMSTSLGFSIPINIATIFLVSFFDVSALICLILFSFTF